MKLSTHRLLVVGVALMLAAIPLAAYGQDEQSTETPQQGEQPGQTPQQDEAVRTFTGLEQDGELRAVDPDTMIFLVVGPEGQEMLFHYNGDTEVVGNSGGVQGLSGQGGTAIHVWYRAEGRDAIAERIELRDSTAAESPDVGL